MTNSVDPDQLASSESTESGSTLFGKTGHVVFSKRRVKGQHISCILKISLFQFGWLAVWSLTAQSTLLRSC